MSHDLHHRISIDARAGSSSHFAWQEPHHQRIIGHFPPHDSSRSHERIPPMIAPQRIVALAPMVAPRRMSVFSYRCRRVTWERGLVIFVSTQEGPKEHLILQRYAVIDGHTILHLYTIPQHRRTGDECVLAQLQSAPIRAPAHTWLKCQTRVRSQSHRVHQ